MDWIWADLCCCFPIGIDPFLANMISKVVSGLFAFVTQCSFTFGVEAGGKAQQEARYLTLLALNVPLAALVLSAMLWVIPMVVVVKLSADVICVFLTERFELRLHSSKP